MSSSHIFSHQEVWLLLNLEQGTKKIVIRRGNVMKRYVYVVFGTLVLLCIGIIYAWSIIAAPIAGDFPDWSSTQLSLTFTISMFSFCIGGFLRGILAEKVPLKWVLWLAAALYGAGLFMSAQIEQSIVLLYIGFGLMAGFAAGLAYNAIMSAVTAWFYERSGLISGVLLMGFGFGGFFTGKLYQELLLVMQWREIFALLAMIIAVLLLLAGCFIHLPQKDDALSAKNDEVTNEKTGVEMIQTRAFQFYFIWLVLLISAGYMIMGHARGILLEASPEVDAGAIATIVGLISIFNGCGRVFFGFLYDQLNYKRTMLVIDGAFAGAVLLMFMGSKLASSGLISMGFVCTGLFFAGAASLNSAFIRDFFGARYFAANFAIANLNVLISSFGSTFAGSIYDALGSYGFVLGLMMIIWGAAFGCTFMIRRPSEEETRRQPIAAHIVKG